MRPQFEWWINRENVFRQAGRGLAWRDLSKAQIGLIVLAVLVILAGGLALQRMRQHQRQVEQVISQQVEEAYALVSAVGRRGIDQESVQQVPQLDAGWALKQAQSYGLAGESLLGLQPMEISPLIIGTTISSDLTYAMLQVNRVYSAGDIATTASPVVLQHTYVFARFGDRWELTVPPDTFWGPWATLDRDRLFVTYPARDAELVKELADDLDAIIEEICHGLVEIHCSDDMQVQLTLDSALASLVALQREQVRAGRGRISLPAPTLVGLPVDRVGYQVLLQDYAAHVAAALVTDIVGWDCGNHRLLYENLLEGRMVCHGASSP